MELTPLDIRNQTFNKKSFNGYDPEEVKALIGFDMITPALISEYYKNAPKIVVGRGTGAILATKKVKKNNIVVLIDPVLSIADAISEKYRILYPKFLVRASTKIEKKDISGTKNVVIISDRARFSDRNHKIGLALEDVNLSKRGEKTLSNAISEAINSK